MKKITIILPLIMIISFFSLMIYAGEEERREFYCSFTKFNASISTGGNNFISMATNGTRFYVLDTGKDFLFFVNSSGANISGGFPTNVTVDTTTVTDIKLNGSGFNFIDQGLSTVRFVNMSGDYSGVSFSIGGAGATAGEGIVYNGSNWFVLDNDDNYVYCFNTSYNNASCGFSLGPFNVGVANGRGLSYNGTHFFIFDETGPYVFVTNSSGSNTTLGFRTSNLDTVALRGFDYNRSRWYFMGTTDGLVKETRAPIRNESNVSGISLSSISCNEEGNLSIVVSGTGFANYSVDMAPDNGSCLYRVINATDIIVANQSDVCLVNFSTRSFSNGGSIFITRNISWVSPSNLSYNRTIPSTVNYASNFTINTVFLHNGSDMFYLNFSLRAPNGTIIYNNVNGTVSNTLATNNFTNWTASYLLIRNGGKDIGQWLWNWTAMDNELTTFASANGSFVISDTDRPNATITNPTGVVNTQTPVFRFVVNDSVEISTCFYNVTKLAGGLEVPSSGMTLLSDCENITLPQLTDSLNYNITLLVNDTSNNVNLTTSNFSVSAGVTPSGGGGGGGPTPCYTLNTTCETNEQCCSGICGANKKCVINLCGDDICSEGENPFNCNLDCNIGKALSSGDILRQGWFLIAVLILGSIAGLILSIPKKKKRMRR